MGCNCKSKIKSKYGIDDIDDVKKKTWWQKILIGCIQLCFGVVVSALFLVALIPFFVFMVFCFCTGKTPHFKLPDVTKWKKWL